MEVREHDSFCFICFLLKIALAICDLRWFHIREKARKQSHLKLIKQNKQKNQLPKNKFNLGGEKTYENCKILMNTKMTHYFHEFQLACDWLKERMNLSRLINCYRFAPNLIAPIFVHIFCNFIFRSCTMSRTLAGFQLFYRELCFIGN